MSRADRRLAEGVAVPDPAAAPAPVIAVVALGSNLGDRAAILAEAVKDLARLPLVDSVEVAEPVESVAVGTDGPDAGAPRYLNSVALLSTRLAPSVLLRYLHAIEARHGRERRRRFDDRTLDLDLVCYGAVTSEDPTLTLPHPRAAERDFVLAPWLKVDPDAVLPGHGRVDVLLARLEGGPR